MHKKLRLVVLCGGLLVACGVAAQQAGTVSVVINVTDITGASVPGAYVRVIPAPDPSVHMETDSKGHAALSLKPGGYALFVRSQGFKPVAMHFDIQDAKEAQTISVVLQVGTGGGVEVQVSGAKEGLTFYLDLYHEPTRVSPAEVKAMAHISVTLHNSHTNADETYSGVRLSDILTSFGAPLGKELHGEALVDYVVATGSDGYKSVLALGEIDPSFHPGEVIVADAMDGKPLDAHNGPFKLVVTEDKRPARSVRNLVQIDLRSAK